MSAESPRLSYHMHPGQGPHLLLVHGFMSSAAQWQPNLEALGAVCTPVTVNLWGHGGSPAPEDALSYRPQAYVEQFEAIRSEIGADRWFLCGYSVGAGLTIRYAHTYPERVIAHAFTNSQSAFADQALVDKWTQSFGATREKILAEGGEAMRKLPAHPRFARNLPSTVARALRADADRLHPRGVALTLGETTIHASVRDIAPTNPRPALLCFGTREKRFSENQAWAAQHMANLSVVPLAAGHAVNMEDAAGFNAAVSEFFRAAQ